jgi:cell division protease FtsH
MWFPLYTFFLFVFFTSPKQPMTKLYKVMRNNKNIMKPILLFFVLSNVYSVYAIVQKYTTKMSFDTENRILYNNRFYKTISYNSLIKNIEENRVSKLYFSDDMDTVVSEDSEKHDSRMDDLSSTNISPYVANNIVDTALKHRVSSVFLHDSTPNSIQQNLSNIGNTIGTIVYPLFFIYFLVSIFRLSQMSQNPSQFMGGGGGLLNRGRDVSSDKTAMIKANISLQSFAGSPEIFQECTEVVSYLKNETIYANAGAEIPRGILLEGPPGTGKTLLAKAIASEADANFISIAASEFVEIFVGMGASKIRNLFSKARANKPCILFIDEIDAVGRQRGAGINMANDEREQTLNQLLAEMDGFADNTGILVIAATNRKDVLDSALLRPGRFDRVITVPLPDARSRRSILDVHCKNKRLADTIHLDLIAELTAGFSGAQLKNLMNEAAIFAARDMNTTINQENILNALDKAIVGIVKQNDTRGEETMRRVAIHETGHALLAFLFKEYFEMKKVSIQSTYNGAGGYTVFNEYLNITEGGLYTKDLLQKRLIVTLGGKAAETIFYGENYVSVGAVQDLKQANDLAKRMIGNFGMGDVLEVFYNENVDGGAPFLGRSLAKGDGYSEKTREIFDRETLHLIDSCYRQAKKLLQENQELMGSMIDVLLDKKILYNEDLLLLNDRVNQTENV